MGHFFRENPLHKSISYFLGQCFSKIWKFLPKKGPYKTYSIVLNWQCKLIPKVEWGLCNGQ
jgi:hypothetical protein